MPLKNQRRLSKRNKNKVYMTSALISWISQWIEEVTIYESRLKEIARYEDKKLQLIVHSVHCLCRLNSQSHPRSESTSSQAHGSFLAMYNPSWWGVVELAKHITCYRWMDGCTDICWRVKSLTHFFIQSHSKQFHSVLYIICTLIQETYSTYMLNIKCTVFVMRVLLCS